MCLVLFGYPLNFYIMDKKEEELLSMHYQMEKTDIKQQGLEDRLISISEDLKKSKNIRNFYFGFIIVLIVLIAVGGVYWTQDNTKNLSEDSNKMQQLQLLNDSLQKEVVKLKTNMYTNDNGAYTNADSTKVYAEGSLGRYADAFRNNSEFSNDTLNSSKLKFERQYCYVNKAYESNDVLFIEVDFIEYYYGKKAVKKAKEYGEAEYDIDKKGDTLYYLYKNYYINNQNPDTRVLEIDDRARVRIDNLNQISKGFPLKAFQKIIASKPILILETNNGIVYKITQQKLP